VKVMVRKSEVTTLSIYIPKSKLEKNPIERLDRLAEKVDRSINYLVVEAILQYLDREEKKK
jgi:predicted transcriptional regulator